MPEPGDLTRVSTRPFARRVEKPWGWELHFVPADWPYLVKILHIKAGARLSLQRHEVKDESILVLSGQLRLFLEEDDGVVASRLGELIL